jgi:hypothetical protein
MVKSITNEFLAMTYPDEYYKNVIEPAKTGKGPVPSKMQMLSKAQPFKAVSLPFQEMMNPGKFGSFRSTATPAAARALGIGRMALGGPFGIAALAGQGLGMGVDAIARATNTPEEYEAMKQAARDQGGFGYFDDVDISQDAATTTTPGSVMNEIEIGTAPSIFDINEVGDPALNPGSVNAMGIDPFGVNEDLIDRGNPLGDSRVVSEEQGLIGGIPDRNRGMPGAPTGAYEMIGGTPVAVGDVLGRQQALEKADFVEETPQGINYDALGILGTLGGLLTGSTALKGLGMFGNIKSGRTGRALDGISRGLGSLGSGMSRFNRAMRGYNPVTGRTNTQAEYEQARANRQLNNRLNYMMERKKKGKSYSKKNLAKVQAQINDRINRDERDALSDKNKSVDYGITGGPTRTDIDVADGGAESGGGKIVCTMMNERYGFGSFRNKIWMKFHEHHGPEYQKGYHAIFLPLVKIAKGEGKINTAVRKVLEHMGRHVTADMFKIMKGKKRDTLGRIYRAIFEPACHIIGKIKSALGRG